MKLFSSRLKLIWHQTTKGLSFPSSQGQRNAEVRIILGLCIKSVFGKMKSAIIKMPLNSTVTQREKNFIFILLQLSSLVQQHIQPVFKRLIEPLSKQLFIYCGYLREVVIKAHKTMWHSIVDLPQYRNRQFFIRVKVIKRFWCGIKSKFIIAAI